MAALLLSLLSLVFYGHARAEATLDDVLVFSGQDHVRVLLVTGSLPASIQARSAPAMAGAPARGTVLLSGTRLGSAGERAIPLNAPAAGRVSISTVGSAVQVTVETPEARVVRAEALGLTAVRVDLVVEGRQPDPELPTDAQLSSWLDGVSLVRRAGGPPRTRKLVVLDAGHGGEDHGAVGKTGTREADVALEIARRAAAGMQQQLGVDVLMTRDADVFVTLRDRAALANRQDADLFLSIHANAAPGPDHWGIETYSLDTASDAGAARVAARENTLVREQDRAGESADPLVASLQVSGTNRLSRELAVAVQAEVIRTLSATHGSGQVRDLGAKTALFYVLVSTRMPAILFEAPFLSNPADERRLRTPHYQQSIADALVRSVGVWLEALE